jgi:hypothetical protein
MKKLRFAALGAALAYFFDPQNGARRRKALVKRLAALAARRGAGPETRPDDVTLARKVESELFGDTDVPKGSVDVDAENGKVVLRGEVDSTEMIDDLVGRARKVQGVEEVENLLRTPSETSSEPAPAHE